MEKRVWRASMVVMAGIFSLGACGVDEPQGGDVVRGKAEDDHKLPATPGYQLFEWSFAEQPVSSGKPRAFEIGDEGVLLPVDGTAVVAATLAEGCKTEQADVRLEHAKMKTTVPLSAGDSSLEGRLSLAFDNAAGKWSVELGDGWGDCKLELLSLSFPARWIEGQWEECATEACDRPAEGDERLTLEFEDDRFCREGQCRLYRLTGHELWLDPRNEGSPLLLGEVALLSSDVMVYRRAGTTRASWLGRKGG